MAKLNIGFLVQNRQRLTEEAIAITYGAACFRRTKAFARS